MQRWVKLSCLLWAFSVDSLASPISLDHGTPISLLTREYDSERSLLIALGELAFKSDALLRASRSFGVHLTCDSCHPDGGTTQVLFIEGLSGKPGTIDITNRAVTLYEDGTFNPVNIPSLFGVRHTEPYSRTGSFATLREFTRFAVVEEFGGMDPADLTLDSLVAYEESLNFLKNDMITNDGYLRKGISISAQRGQIIFAKPFPGNPDLACATCHDPKGFFVDGQKHDIGTGMEIDTPTLRDLSISAPYMHDGRYDSLEEVIDFFDKQYALGLDQQEAEDLRTYLGIIGGGNASEESAVSSVRLDSLIRLLSKTLEAKDWSLGKMVTDQALVEINAELVKASPEREKILGVFVTQLAQIDSFNKIENYEESMEILDDLKAKLAAR